MLRTNQGFLKKSQGANGVQLITGTNATTPAAGYGSTARWTSLVVNEEAVVNTATFVDREGNDLSLTPSWLDATLAVGSFIPFGTYQGKEVFVNSITLTSGSVLCYFD